MKDNLIGKKFGRWVVLEEFYKIHYKGGTRIMWVCLCECGTKKIIRAGDLRSGRTNSCGCLRAEERRFNGQFNYLLYKSEYFIWSGMKDRCSNPNCNNYSNYGGRGIKVCDRWLESFDNFLSDMGEKPSKGHSIDRFQDVNGNYEPSNCRWATRTQQSRCKRNNRYIEYNKERLILVDWAKRFKISHAALRANIKRNGVLKAMEYYFKKSELSYPLNFL